MEAISVTRLTPDSRSHQTMDILIQNVIDATNAKKQFIADNEHVITTMKKNNKILSDANKKLMEHMEEEGIEELEHGDAKWSLKLKSTFKNDKKLLNEMFDDKEKVQEYINSTTKTKSILNAKKQKTTET